MVPLPVQPGRTNSREAQSVSSYTLVSPRSLLGAEVPQEKWSRLSEQIFRVAK